MDGGNWDPPRTRPMRRVPQESPKRLRAPALDDYRARFRQSGYWALT